jgi:hypothetical protein
LPGLDQGSGLTQLVHCLQGTMGPGVGRWH